MARYVVGAKFPPGVRLEDDAILDLALEQRYRASASARVYLQLIARGCSVDEIVQRVSGSAGPPPNLVQAHCGALIASLNDVMLLNLDLGGVRGRMQWTWFTFWSALLERRAPAPRRQRFPINQPAARALMDIARGVLSGMAHWWLVLGVLSLFALYGSPSGDLAIAAVLSLPTAIVIHETAHAIAIRRSGGGGFLSVRGLSVGVIHSRARSGATVHAAAPLLTGACGSALLTLALAVDSGALAIASVPFIGQMLTLTVFAADGRLLVRHMSGPVDERCPRADRSRRTRRVHDGDSR